MTLLTRAQIVAAQDFRTEDIDVPEWGGVLRVRALSGRERSLLEKMFGLGKDAAARPVAVNPSRAVAPEPTWTNWRSWLVANSAVDENMKPVFTPTDVDALGDRSAAPLDRIANVVLRISGISKEEQEEMGKDSAPTTTAEP